MKSLFTVLILLITLSCFAQSQDKPKIDSTAYKYIDQRLVELEDGMNKRAQEVLGKDIDWVAMASRHDELIGFKKKYAVKDSTITKKGAMK